jgi:predicted Zn-dependent peptidase
LSVRTTTLDNGMTVITDDMPHLESASLGIWVKAGSRSETLAEHGVSHVLEHMAFKGTASRTALEIAETIENVGGDLNAATSVEHTGYFARVLREDVPLAADILSDILQNSLFDQNELDREQQVIVQEIGAARDNPDDHVFDLFQEAAFPDQPIGRTILGTVDSVKSFSPATVRDYMERNYVGDQMVVCAAGNVDHEALVDIAANRFHDLRTSGAPVPQKAKYVGGESRILSEHEQAHIVLGFEGRAYNSDGFYAAQILASILGGGMSSRLFQEVREKRGLCYSVFSFGTSYEDVGQLGVYAATSPEHTGELIDVTSKVMMSMGEMVTAKEVDRAKAQLKASLVMNLESASSRADQIARQYLAFGTVPEMSTLVERISAVTPDDVKALAHGIFAGQLPSLSAVGQLSALESHNTIAARFKKA